jgi:tRNA A-37 threonylcarbamoyl transferase component Bud32
VKILISNGADVNATDVENKTAEDDAKEKGHHEIVKVLQQCRSGTLQTYISNQSNVIQQRVEQQQSKKYAKPIKKFEEVKSRQINEFNLHFNKLEKQSDPFKIENDKKKSEFDNTVFDNNLKNYKEIKKIADGGQSTLYLCEYKGKKVVLKCYRCNSNDELNFAMEEFKLLNKLQHENILPILNGFISENNTSGKCFILVEPYMKNGDLFCEIMSRRTKKKSFKESEIISILYQLLITLKFIHENKVIHRDVKSANIFIEKSEKYEYHVYLCDFGTGKKVQTSIQKTMAGTEDYMSPEMKSNKPYSSKTDLFSLGCVLYELMSLQHRSMSSEMSEALLDGIDFFGELKKSCYKYSTELINIMMQLLQRKPENRCSAAELLNHPIFNQFKKPVQSSKENDEKTCVICMENIPSYVLVPCGHMLCEACKDKVNVCPVCRKRISSRVKAYL